MPEFLVSQLCAGNLVGHIMTHAVNHISWSITDTLVGDEKAEALKDFRNMENFQELEQVFQEHHIIHFD